MELRSRNILLRPWQEEDASGLAELANNRNIADMLRDGFPHPYTLVDAVSWIHSTIAVNNPPTLFAIMFEEKLAGGIGILLKDNIYRKNVEIGYWIGETFWGKGIATEAVKLIVEYIFRNFNVVRIYAETFTSNKASSRVLEKNGFVCEGIFSKAVIKNEVLLDSATYALLRQES
ncbi:MAG: GNAT family N-acetyltransferase [Bacteroidales bacterium]